MQAVLVVDHDLFSSHFLLQALQQLRNNLAATRPNGVLVVPNMVDFFDPSIHQDISGTAVKTQNLLVAAALGQNRKVADATDI